MPDIHVTVTAAAKLTQLIYPDEDLSRRASRIYDQIAAGDLRAIAAQIVEAAPIRLVDLDDLRKLEVSQ